MNWLTRSSYFELRLEFLSVFFSEGDEEKRGEKTPGFTGYSRTRSQFISRFLLI